MLLANTKRPNILSVSRQQHHKVHMAQVYVYIKDHMIGKSKARLMELIDEDFQQLTDMSPRQGERMRYLYI